MEMSTVEKKKMVTNGVKESWSGGVTLVVLCKELRDGLTNELTSEKRPEWNEGGEPSHSWCKNMLGLCEEKQRTTMKLQMVSKRWGVRNKVRNVVQDSTYVNLDWCESLTFTLRWEAIGLLSKGVTWVDLEL